MVRRPVAWAIVVLTALLTVVSAGLALHVEQDDDVLAFLPRTNPDIQAFYRINDRFGSTDVALVGIDVPDAFDPELLRRVDALSRSLREVQGLDSALTLTNMADFVADPQTGGIITGTLVNDIPESAEEVAALREAIMAKEQAVGTVVSEDGDAIQVLAFGTEGTEPRELAERVRAVVEDHFPTEPKYWGGAPFISTWIFNTTQDDMAALTPWAVVAIVVIMFAAFRDVVGVGLGLGSTVIGILVSRALMSAFGVRFNIVLSSMPIILFAVGSAYAIHMLSRYYDHARQLGEGRDAMAATLRQTGPTVLAAGLTTVAGLLSFLLMDIAPMRTFGLFTAIGIFTALVLSLTFVPAVISLWPRPVRREVGGPLLPLMHALARATRLRRPVALILVGTIATLGATFAGRVNTRMDLAAFFNPGSPPEQAQSFLDRKFGGSQFIQLHVEGDLDDPEVVREVGRIADRIRLVPHVTSVVSVEDALSLVGEAMSGARRVPDTRGQVGVLYRFLSSDPASNRLVYSGDGETRSEALVQVKVGSSRAEDLDAVLDRVEAIVAEEAITAYTHTQDADAVRERVHGLLTARVQSLAHRAGHTADPGVIRAHLSAAPPAPKADALRHTLRAFLLSDESFVPLTEEQAAQVAHAIAALGPDASDLDAALAEVLDPDTAGDLSIVLDGPLDAMWRAQIAKADADALLTALNLPDPPATLRASLSAALQSRGNADAMIASDAPDATPLAWTVNGMPVLYRGLSRSVTANQFKSLGMALALVFVILTVLFRSPAAGLLATAPTAFTLLLVYGGMGWMGVHLDIGTSMLASIIIGAGVDYAVHLLAAWRAPAGATILDAAKHAIEETSHAIWTNALMVAAGFFVLTLGQARPLQNVGGLTSAAMIAAALSTFIVIPLFAGRLNYLRTPRS